MTKLFWWSWPLSVPVLGFALVGSTAVPQMSIAATVPETRATEPKAIELKTAEPKPAIEIAAATAVSTPAQAIAATVNPVNQIDDQTYSEALTIAQSVPTSPSVAAPQASRSTDLPAAPTDAAAQHSMNQFTPVSQLTDSPSTEMLSTTEPSAAMGQLTSVSQLSDVKPTDWAYQALQSLVERYGCIVGYPDRTYRGQRALTRFESAAGVNACLDRISELLASSTADLVTKADLATLQRLQEEFASELTALRGRVDALETRTAALEANQFSTTTKLSGETLFYVATIFNQEQKYRTETVFQYRSRLIFDTSFTGTDQLRARLQAGTLQPYNQVGNELGFGAFGNTNGQFVLDLLSYQFVVGKFARFNIFANAAGLDDATFGNTINPLDNPARSAITRFGQRNAIYRTAFTSAGIAANLFFTDNISAQLAYLAGSPANSNPGSGLLNGNYGALGQLTFRNLFKRLDLAFTYVNGYTGTALNAEGILIAGVPFGLGSKASRVNVGRPVIANSYGIEANFKILPQLQLGGWVGFSAVRALGLGDADVWNYAVTLALPDLFKKGSLGGLIFGMQPRLTGADPLVGAKLGERKDPNVGFHIEAFYRYAFNDNIDITPAFICITAPNHDSSNPPEFMGVLRTTFRF